MQNTTGKLMERIVARKLAEDLETRNILPPNQGGYRAGKSTWENAARFAYDVYEGFQTKEQTLAVAVDLEDAYNRVQFKLLMEILVQYGVSLTLTRWLAAALQERKIAMQLGNAPQPTVGLPQGFPLSPVLYNIYTNGLADLNSNGFSRMLTLADDGLIYKTASDINTAVTAVQEQLEKVSHWCQETESEINPGKAQALWCTLNNKAVGQAMPTVSFNGHRTQEHPQIHRDQLRGPFSQPLESSNERVHEFSFLSSFVECSSCHDRAYSSSIVTIKFGCQCVELDCVFINVYGFHYIIGYVPHCVQKYTDLFFSGFLGQSVLLRRNHCFHLD